MIVKKIKSINGVCFIQKEINRDVQNGRRIIYSLPASIARGIPTLFRYIYGLKYTIVNQLDGMRVAVDNDIYLALNIGKVQVYLIDLRKDSDTYLKQINLTLSHNTHFQQIYIPHNVAWGIVNLNETSNLHITSSNPLSRDDNMYIVDPFDLDMNLKITMGELSVQKYETIYSLAEINDILYPEEQQGEQLQEEVEYKEEVE